MYTLTLLNINTLETKEVKGFNTKKEAQKEKRTWAKKLELIKHAGHLVNYSKGIEIHTNY